MGTIQHKVLIVIGEEKKVKKLHKRARKMVDMEIAQDPDASLLDGVITPIYKGMNYFHSFAIMPSGSKVGWPNHRIAQDIIDEIMLDSDGIEYLYIEGGELPPKGSYGTGESEVNLVPLVVMPEEEEV